MRDALRVADVRLRKLRELRLAPSSSAGRHAYISAGSGLVRVGERLYVIADDEHHLGVFPAKGDKPGRLIRLFPGELPRAKGQRKALKPDLEALTFLHPFPGYPCGALLAVGSGSRPNRRMGALLALNAKGLVAGKPRLIDLTPVYDSFPKALSPVNIEGAVILGDSLFFLQRGNKGEARNASIQLPLSSFAESWEHPGLKRRAPKVRNYDLGRIAGIPLCFTDAAALPDGGYIFTAVAENTRDSYRDGACAGAAIGIIGRDGRLKRIDRLLPSYKVEGIDARVDGDVISFLVVTDADDARIPAALLEGEMVLRRSAYAKG